MPIVVNWASSNLSCFVLPATILKTLVLKKLRVNASNVAKRNPVDLSLENIPKPCWKFARVSSAHTRKSRRSSSQTGPASSKISKSNICAASTLKSSCSIRAETWWRRSASPSGTQIRSKSSLKHISSSPKPRPTICEQTGFEQTKKLTLWRSKNFSFNCNKVW